ncbi:hypothetical protein [Bacillus suaedae]|uniref:Uncharacterized protein n=1 Tax=Halalkalibacter suaedae TaxID=2822140 RepID=A0A940WPE8_9BACI|nr:hypothetical protein [Bacillus suaedae]MBP3950090.1 hypothetical protein [Bacillus suaedae]
MVFNYCPSCGTKRENQSMVCQECQFVFPETEEVQEELIDSSTREWRSYSKGIRSSTIFSIVSYVTNILFVLCYVWMYFVCREMLERGEFELLQITLSVIVAILFYIPSALVYYRQGGYAFWISAGFNILFIVPSVGLFLQFKSFYNEVGYMAEGFTTLIFVAMAPVVFASLMTISHIIIISIRFINKKTQ